MRSLNESIEGASEFSDFMRKATERGPKPRVTIARLAGENRQMHRERVKRERREEVKRRQRERV